METITNTDKTVNKTSKTLLIFAYGLLVIGVIVGACLITNFYTGYVDIQYRMKISDLGTILAGTVGLLWSLAGVFFFIYNLQQQKETLALQREDLTLQREELALQRQELANQVLEMKTSNHTAYEQQKAISEQTLNNLFYNLLESNKKLIEFIGLDSLRETYIFIIAACKNYKKAIVTNFFDTIDETKSYPPLSLSRLPDHKTNDLKILIENVLDVIIFIETKMEKKEFYHRMFFNQLSFSERFLIGFIFTFKLYDTEMIKAHFDYSKTYKMDKSLFLIEDGYFPELSVKVTGTEKDSIFKYDGLSKSKTFQFYINQNVFNKKLILKETEVQLLVLGRNMPPILTFQIESDKEIFDGIEIDSNHFLHNFNYQNTNSIPFLLKMKFHFQYKEEIYFVVFETAIQFDFNDYRVLL